MLTLDKRSIEEILLEQGILIMEHFKRTREIQRETGSDVETILLSNGFVKKVDILKAKALKMQVDFIDLTSIDIDIFKYKNIVTPAIAKRHILIPIGEEDGLLVVAMKDPTDIFVVDDLRLATTMEIKAVFADPDEIENFLPQYFPEEYSKPNSNTFDPSATLRMDEIPYDDFNNFSNEMNSPVFTKGRLGDLMVKSGIISDSQLSYVLSVQAKKGGMLGEILVKENLITKKTLFGFLEMQLGVHYIDLSNLEVPFEIVSLVNESLARRNTLVPIGKEGNTIKVAMSDPMNIFTIDDLRLSTGCEILPFLSDEDQINGLLDKTYNAVTEANKKEEEIRRRIDLEAEIEKVHADIAAEIQEQNQFDVEELDVNDLQNAPIVKMVNILFSKAVTQGASDIHIEPQEDCVLVRYRVDGQLIEVMKYDKKILSALVARIKIISGLNIAEKRIPQDGRITMKIDVKTCDLRVSILPTFFGEKIVIRISDKEGFKVDKRMLGFFEDDLQKFESILSHPHGIVLVTGPTGSGKSTTLYAALGELCKPNVNVLTVEDPIESVIKGANQVQVNVKAGLDFASALRSFLRQDPDIIMVGEIRDGETAEIASRAAITGHLVLSTLHTNDAASSITRLIDMGIESFMVSSSIVGVIAQRLVRRLCKHCKTEYIANDNDRELLKAQGKEDLLIYKQNGCNHCNSSGFKGRIAVYEIMVVDRDLRGAIAKNSTVDVLKEIAVKNGMKTLRENCIRLVRAGVTTIDEMLKVTYSND